MTARFDVKENRERETGNRISSEARFPVRVPGPLYAG
jgi:hypothetical protein